MVSPDILVELLDLPRFRTAVKGDVMAHLCADLQRGDWWQQLDAIKVTGSNGKGSVATMTASILQAAGLRVGLTVSPHILTTGERIQIDGQPATQEELAAAAVDLRARMLDAPASPLAFEAVTALAFEVFRRRRVEVVVAEAGIGGRHDSTRILPGRVSVLVSVDYEHRSILGESLEAIALDKADLAAEGSELLLGRLPASLYPVLERHGEARGIRMRRWQDWAVVAASRRCGHGQIFDLELLESEREAGLSWHDLWLPMVGRHQIDNAVLAILAARRFLARHRGSHQPVLEAPSIEASKFAASVRSGLERVFLPGRLQQLHHDPPLFVDVAHTPDSTRQLAESLEQLLDRPLLLVLGISSDKDAAALAAPLIDLASKVLVTRAKERGGDSALLESLVRDAGGPVQRIEPVASAVDQALVEARREGMAVLVAGGLFLARETAEHLSP